VATLDRASDTGADRGAVDSSAAATARRALRGILVPALVGLVLVTPSFAWVAIDRTIWAWDESYYGTASIDLWATLRLTQRAWWHAMTHVFVIWPPAIAWIGQFFVPLGGVLGSDQVALLLGNNVALAFALALLYGAGLRLADGRWLPALTGALAAAGAPLLVNLSHFYLVEPIQILAVVWVLFVMVSARRWHLSLTVVQLGAAVAFGLLTKLSTPAYVAAPAAVALVLSFMSTRSRTWGRWWLDLRFLGSTLLMLILVFSTAAWYRVNFNSAWDHAQLAATSTYWGAAGSFGTHLHFWLAQLRDAQFLPYFDLAVAAVLVGAVVVALRRRNPRSPGSSYDVLVLIGCLGVPAGALVLLANQVNTDVRYIVPVVPAIALGLVAALRILDDSRITTLLAVVFACQFGLMAFESFSSNAPSSLVRLAYHGVPQSSSTFPDQVDRLVAIACANQPDGGWNTVGTSYAWLNANTLTMLGAEQVALDMRQCRWTGVTYSSADPDGWQNFTAESAAYLLTVDYGNAANPLPAALVPSAGLGSALDRQINGGNAKLLRRAISSGTYVVVPGSRRLGLVLLRHA
jgi:hypothetical protein